MGSQAVRSWKSKWEGCASALLRARMLRSRASLVEDSEGGMVRRARRR